MTDGAHRSVRTLCAGVVCLALLVCMVPAAAQQRGGPASATSFAGLVARLSERAGYFDTDNLISNERSYLHVVPELRALAGRERSVYLGVGPDQNFSYIAHLRPSLAILIDIRRDNLLLHLLFKAIFAESRTRLEYLMTLTGRRTAAEGTPKERPLEDIVGAVERNAPLAESDLRALRVRLTDRIRSYGVPLSDEDLATIDRFHRRFITDGLSLRFNTFGRQPQFDYPTFRDLLLETDRQGVRRSYLATEQDFQFVKRMHAEDRIVPVVADLAGSTSLAAIARYLEASNLNVAALYTSNVEFYLFREGSFDPFIANLRRLPKLPGALIVRSVFGFGGASVSRVPGYNSASMTQSISTLLGSYASGQVRSYRDLTR